MTFSQFNLYQQLTSCRAVQASNLAGSYYNGQTNNGVGATLTVTATGQLTIDSVDVNIGDRVLLQAQTSDAQNGIYVVVDNGEGGDNPILQRSADFQNIEQMKGGQYVPISAGTSHAGEVYVLVEPLPGALGVDAISFATSSGSVPPGVLLAANNLSDVANAGTSRTNLGLGTAATKAATNAGSSFVVSTTGAVTSGQLAAFVDVNGSVSNSGVVAANVQLATNIKAVISADIGGGGAGPITITQTGVLPTSIITANIVSSSNTVSIAKVTPGTGNFDVLFSADPGAACVIQYIVFIAGQ